MALSKRAWLVISGIQWFAMGAMLLIKGLRYLTSLLEPGAAQAPLAQSLVSVTGSLQQAVLCLISVALLIGFIKGRMVLSKAVGRIADRIEAQGDRLTLKQVYDQRYYFILAIMMGLGFLMRSLHLPLDIRGGIDVAIGSALINGSLLYYRRIGS